MDARYEAQRLYQEEHLSPSEIADKLQISRSTIKTWKRRDNWDSDSTLNPDSDSKRNPRAIKPGTEPFEPKNQKATIHGLFARYLPEETRDILEQLKDRSEADILYDQIRLAYAALIRAQQLMYVRDQKDITTTKVGESDGATCSEKWDVQLPWDKHASFLNAQAKAQASLNNMIKQYEEMSHYELIAEEQRAKIEQIKATTKKLQEDQDSTDQKSRVVIHYDI
jgi:uncharacterized protein YjcR